MKVVDSPPGTTRPSSPSSSSRLRTSTGSAPSRRSIAPCSRKFPWTARTPIRGLGTQKSYPRSGGWRRRRSCRRSREVPAPPPAQAESDEQEADEREDSVRDPVARAGDPRNRGGRTRPLDGEVGSGGDEPDGGQDSPARALRQPCNRRV